MELIKPQQIEVKTRDGETRTYFVSRFPATYGREIIAKYPLSAMPKLGDYAVNEETMLKLMGYVAVPHPETGGPGMRLSTRALVDNHVPDWEALARIEVAMMEYNVSFFGNGRASTFFEGFAKKAQAWISKTLMDSLAQSSPKGKPPFTN